MTIAVALRASSIAPPSGLSGRPAARGKKITRSASRGTSSKRRDHAAPRGGRRRARSGTAAHMPCVELLAERLDQRAPPRRRPRRRPRRGAPRRDRASCAGTSQLARLSWRLWQADRVAPDDLPTPRTSTGPAPAPRSRRPCAHGLRGHARARSRAASSGGAPSASCAASVEECVQPDPWAAPSGCRAPGIVDERGRRRRRGRRPRSRWPPVTTTDVAGRARGRGARAPRRRAAASAPASTRASGRFGVTTVARGSSSSRSASSASSSSSRAPDSATITGSSTTGVPGGSSSSACGDRLASRAGRASRSSRRRRRGRRATARTCSTMNSGGTGCTPRDGDGVLRGERGERRRAVHAGSGRTP